MDDSDRSTIIDLSIDMAYDLARGACFADVTTGVALNMTADVAREVVL